MIAGKPADNRSMFVIFGIGVGMSIVFGLIGLVAGKRR
jgi:hypothetical protein